MFWSFAVVCSFGQSILCRMVLYFCFDFIPEYSPIECIFVRLIIIWCYCFYLQLFSLIGDGDSSPSVAFAENSQWFFDISNCDRIPAVHLYYCNYLRNGVCFCDIALFAYRRRNSYHQFHHQSDGKTSGKSKTVFFRVSRKCWRKSWCLTSCEYYYLLMMTMANLTQGRIKA